MFTAEIHFSIMRDAGEDRRNDAVDFLLGRLRQNGQILGKGFWFARDRDVMRAFMELPAVDALATAHNNKHVTKGLSALEESGLSQPVVRVFTEGDEGQKQAYLPQSYILFTNYLIDASPLRSGTTFEPIPLYTIPPTYDESEYYNILLWQSDYQACDTLQMNCQTGERFALRQMSEVNSSLSKRGRETCDQITTLTALPTYYSLHRYKLRTTWAAEIARKCPGCGGEWLLNEHWHIFDFKCDACLLVSYMSGGTEPPKD